MQLDDGNAQNLQLIPIMQAMVDSTDETGLVIETTAAIAANAPRGNVMAQLQLVYDWLRSHVMFRRDPRDKEHVTHPDVLLERISTAGKTSADCDDVATLGAAMVRALGFDPVFILAGPSKTGPFTHVFFGVQMAGRTVPMDPQEGFPIGTWPPALQRYRIEAATRRRS